MSKPPMIRITLQAGAASAPGEPCLLQVRLRNDGDALLTVDNPAALLDGPRWRVTWPATGRSSIIDNRRNFVAPEGQSAQLNLAGGAVWQAQVPLHLPALEDGPGGRAVQLILSTPGGVVESEACLVQVQDWASAAADAAYGVSNFGKSEGDSLWLQPGSAGAALYRMGWGEDHSDRQGLGGGLCIRLRSVGALATDLLVPQRDAPFWQDPARWLLWREGDTVHALDTSLRPQTLTLADEPAELLRPALQRDGGPVEVFALAASRREILLLRFPRDAASQAAVVDRYVLDFTVAAGCAGFAARAGLLVALLASTGPRSCRLFLMRPGDHWAQVSLDAVSLLRNSAPTLQVLADGAVRVAALVQGEDHMVAVASARFDGNGLSAVDIQNIGVVATPIAEAALLLGGTHGHDPAHEHVCDSTAHAPSAHVLIRLAEGSMLRLGSSGQLEPAAFSAPPVQPLTLLPGGHGALVLACSAQHGPFVSEA